MGLFGGGKKDTRHVDEGLAALHGKSEAEAIEWWKQRLTLIAAIPSDTARVGAVTPQLRELSRIEIPEERKRLTRARLIAMAQLSPDKRQLLIDARTRAWTIDPGVLESDQKLVEELLPTLDESARSAAPQRA